MIDGLLPKKSGHNIPHSTVVKAMCINGLGFTERRLYLLPAFFENLPTERLLGEGVLPEHLNDDVFGRTLDKIQILQISVFMVTMTTIMMATISITYGHPKDKRDDLLRFTISMVTDQKGIPLFVRALDGNSSDKSFRVSEVYLKKESYPVFSCTSALFCEL